MYRWPLLHPARHAGGGRAAPGRDGSRRSFCSYLRYHFDVTGSPRSCPAVPSPRGLFSSRPVRHGPGAQSRTGGPAPGQHPDRAGAAARGGGTAPAAGGEQSGRDPDHRRQGGGPRRQRALSSSSAFPKARRCAAATSVNTSRCWRTRSASTWRGKACVQRPSARATARTAISFWHTSGSRPTPSPEGPRLAAIAVDSSEEMRDREEQGLQQLMRGNRIAAAAVAHEVRNFCGAISFALRDPARPLRPRRGPRISKASEPGRRTRSDRVPGAAVQLPGENSSTCNLRDVLNDLRILIEPDWHEIEGTVRWHHPGRTAARDRRAARPAAGIPQSRP